MKKYFKIAGLGCAGIIVLFIITSIIIGFSNMDEHIDTGKSKSINTFDSVELKQKKKIKDSLYLIAEQKRTDAHKKLKGFRKKEDEFNGVTYYRDKRAPTYTNINFIYPYIVNSGTYYGLKIKFQYTSNDWLFIERGILLIDGEKFTISGDWKRDNNTTIWEWLDLDAESAEIDILNKIANSKDAKVRYEGSQYYKDRSITSKEKDIIKKTLEVYNDLK